MEVKYSLEGIDSNAFSIMGYVAKSMKREYKSDEEINAYREDAESDDYQHLLLVSQKKLNELNK